MIIILSLDIWYKFNSVQIDIFGNVILQCRWLLWNCTTFIIIKQKKTPTVTNCQYFANLLDVTQHILSLSRISCVIVINNPVKVGFTGQCYVQYNFQFRANPTGAGNTSIWHSSAISSGFLPFPLFLQTTLDQLSTLVIYYSLNYRP